jgi:hypothetical protein
MRVGGQRHAPAALAPGKTRYPLYRRLGEPGQVQKISSLPGFDIRTVQPVASRYIDCVMPAQLGFNVQVETIPLTIFYIVFA